MWGQREGSLFLAMKFSWQAGAGEEKAAKAWDSELCRFDSWIAVITETGFNVQYRSLNTWYR